MFTSKFQLVAEVEALRAGFNPSNINPHDVPRLVPIRPEGASVEHTRSGQNEASIRAEMERRVIAHAKSGRSSRRK